MDIRDVLLLVVLLFLLALLVTVFVHMVFLVPFVPTKRRVVEKMVEEANIQRGETVFDLGCGDGRLLFAAEKKLRGGGGGAVGFELAPLVYLLARLRKALRRSTANIRLQSLFSANLREANVIFCYLIPSVMPRLSEKILAECRPGTRIISNTFHIPGLTPTRVIEKNIHEKMPTIYMYQISA